ncbi:UNVERIFIED_CONTAM: hypothetical protein Scaly_3109200 [Sesamum calycinum]|uniref:Endonuclease/exonuclease/phosphatase domain-containing protein n=1 Tax=Sesamum calycinum TaxID=2727403 RepID=A0AAW2JKU0_9LAMI
MPQPPAAAAPTSTAAPAAAAPTTTAAPAATAAPAKSLPELFFGNIPLNPHMASKIDEDKIAEAFHNSTRKTLNYIPPSVQNGEVIVRPSIDMIRTGSHRWKTTAVGYFLGKKPYFHHLNEFKSRFGSNFDTCRWELWTTEGLSTVASGIGRPLYPDAITRACTRLDFARVCVMLNISSKLPKHVVIMMPNEIGGMPYYKTTKPVVSIYVRKSMPITPAAQILKMKEHDQAAPVQENIHPETEVDRINKERPGNGRDKAIWNVRGLNRRDHQVAVRDLVCEFRLHFITLLETRVLQSNVTRIQSGILSRWRWFVDYAGPGNRIWIAWNDELIDVDILNVGTQFVHCRVLVHELHESIFITVVYGANDVSTRRELWQELIDLAGTIGNEPWLVGGDFNAVLDMSEVSGTSGDIRVAMNEFNDCILQTGLLSLPMQGERFTWHNCSLDGRAFGRDWIGDCRNMKVSLFRFDNFLALSPGFLASVQSIWRHPVVGTPMYSVTRKLKALKLVFRQQRRRKGDLAMNVKLAAGFLEIAQNILQFDRHNSLLLLLEHCCRLVYLKASKLETDYAATESEASMVERWRPMLQDFLPSGGH